MKRSAWAKAALAAVVTSGVVVAMWHLDDAPVLPEPQDPYRDVTRCRSSPYEMALVDANGDAYPDIAILCGNELLTVSGVDGDSLWRHDFGDGMKDPLGARGWPALVADDWNHLIVGYSGAIVSVDAATGATRWSRQLGDWTPEIEVGDGCLVAEGAADRKPIRLALESGEPSSCSVPLPRRAGVVEQGLTLLEERVPEKDAPPLGDTRLTLSRNGEPLWSVLCEATPCYPKVTSIGVLVTGYAPRTRESERAVGIARLLDLHTGRVTRVLEPEKRWYYYSAPSRFWFLPPYLIAARGHGRPILEVFMASSLVPLWRTEPDEAPVLWRVPPSAPGDAISAEADTAARPASEVPAPVQIPCATGITARPATGPDDVVFRLRRTGCLGSCPVYVVEIFADGRVRYEGMSVDGAPERQLSGEQLEELTRHFLDNGFFGSCEATSGRVLDAPRIFLDFWDGARVKHAEADHLLLHSPLSEFGEAVDRAVEIEQVIPPRDWRRAAW